jgi:F0F1-type ATP synthase assembly protein I
VNINKEEEENRHKFIREGAQYLTIGTEIFLPILLGALAGYYLIDMKYGTKPLWTVILTLVGFVVGMYGLIKTVIKVKKD